MPHRHLLTLFAGAHLCLCSRNEIHSFTGLRIVILLEGITACQVGLMWIWVIAFRLVEPATQFDGKA